MWISKKKYVELFDKVLALSDRVQYLERRGTFYFGGTEMTVAEALRLIMRHLDIEIYKPNCNLKIREKTKKK